MMERVSLSNKRKAREVELTDLVFSWSLEDIFNEDLYKNQVEKIPVSFQSVEHYLGSYVFPLLEETRAELASSMEILDTAPLAVFKECKLCGELLYNVKVDYWRNRFNDRAKEPYRTLPGDIFVISDVKPETISDLQCSGTTWTFASVTYITENENEDDSSITQFRIKASKDIEVKDGMQKSMFVVFLRNITRSKRIWNMLHKLTNMKIIKKILCTDSMVEETCDRCSRHNNSQLAERFSMRLLSKLNEPQTEAILASLHKMECNHKTYVKLIWGPPGTGKTMTVSVMLFSLLSLNRHRILTCAPTSVAIKEVASRVLKMVKESFEGSSLSGTCPLGDILLLGNEDRLKIGGSDIKDIYLDFRVKRLEECLGVCEEGWKHCLDSMIDFLENCVSQYHIFVENELIKAKALRKEGEPTEVELKSFLDFASDRFKSTASPLRRCLFIICTHLPKHYIPEHNFQNIVSVFNLLDSLEKLFQENVVSEELEEILSHQEIVEDTSESLVETSLLLLSMKRSKCLSVLRTLRLSLEKLNLPSVMIRDSIMEFCFRKASLIFCTASSSYKLHWVKMEPLNLVVIDEAAQLKECESTIPLQLPGMRHAILIGDERQLPAMVMSEVSGHAGFGRSLFERLSSSRHPKHLLNIQYRMHPKISFFPNLKFYHKSILDAPNVSSKSYERHYLPGPMFGPYSFINVIGGKEELDDVGHSRRNMVEVAIILKIVQNLYRAWNGSEKKLSIGVVSPYAAQVVAIQEKLGRKYENLDGFMVTVKSIDGFQGGEDDIVIMSTVRTNKEGSIGFLASPQRTNVALTRARHCLWVLGNEKTLSKSRSVWTELVQDAKYRQCFFNADEDRDMAKTILNVKKELYQLDDLLNGDSVLFKSARWEVLFSDQFRKSFGKLTSVGTKKSVMNLLQKLSSGWRPKKRNVDSVCESSSQIVKQFKVEGLYVVCTIDIVKKSRYIQVLKVWDILPLEGISQLVKRLNSIFAMYTDDFINCCKEKSFEGDLEIPKSWGTSYDIVQFKNICNNEFGSESSVAAVDGRSYVENSKVSESLLLMKFYSLSSSVVRHLLSGFDGGELDLPFEVTDQELEIILFGKSIFIVGRSGTGKTTVLTMKLFQKEQQHRMATDGFYVGERSATKGSHHINKFNECIGETKGTVLRQLFVTVSPKLCCAVKQHVSRLKSFTHGRKFSAENSSIDMDDMEEFKDIPDSFVEIPPNKYPLVITFHKFLMMLDGTLGNSYFERFSDVREFSHRKTGASRSVALQTFTRVKEVNYDRFCSFYWPHFNTKLIKNLDPAVVFTEIISNIKGGLQAGGTLDGKLSKENYVSLSERRVSTLSKQKREVIYDIFQDYEKMKMEKGEFDIDDLVIDLHHRLQKERFEGDEMDFVYIDEVQDLTMRQIALFKNVCRNVDEGFVFSGDTAQTIARGIDFRFQEIRHLFYDEFISKSRSNGSVGKKEKGQISQIFNLTQNFRTHAGVLKLAQSIIELLYRFFPQSIDVLKPETSLIYGEAPILLESGNDESAIVTIFGNCGNGGGNFVGFGAEQVILVRDDDARKEISDFVGKRALVLTIVECKGLEFQDVLLYNFFGSSPLTNQWRVIYEYMKEQDMLDANSPKSFPKFSETKHSVLRSELKQLYVAITRTRQRLWICENIDELFKPMFDYWKKLCLVQVKQLDDSLAQAMQVASNQEEWKSRGIKLFWEKNYQMATMCFERAGDAMWEKRSKATGLKAAADRLHGSNPEKASTVLREAAEIFDSIGRAKSAAECFCDLGEYERAGRIYLEKCGDSELKKAGECFSLAGCYLRAAEVYAKGKYYSDCLSVCTKGKLFYMGLQYIQYWKQHIPMHGDMVTRCSDIEKIAQEFLESCALNYYELKDNRSMMKFVRGFHSMDLKRNFLKSSNCLDELFLLEEESGNFLEAAGIAKLRGDLLLEADLLGKAGHFGDASLLMLWYVFSNSLWISGSKGWPLKQFAQKKELLANAKLLAKKESYAFSESYVFYESVCTEVNILSNEQNELFELNQYFNASQRRKILRGEILSVRKILDSHFHFNTLKYVWEDELIVDLIKHSEERISQNEISVETLVYFWNLWKEYVVNIFEYLGGLETQNISKYQGYGEFCLNYFGVRRQFNNLNITYVLINSDADWVRELDDRFLRSSGKLVSVDVRQFVSAAQTHWHAELLAVGKKVLETIEALYNFSTRNLSVFCQSMCLIHIFEVTKFLLESKFLGLKYHDTRTLQTFLKISTEYFQKVFPLDWRKSLAENMISLRGTELSRKLLEEVVRGSLPTETKVSGILEELTYGQIGRVVMVWLGSKKPADELCEEIVKRFDGNSSWRIFIEKLRGNKDPDSSMGSPYSSSDEGLSRVSLVHQFHKAMADAFNANWRKEIDYISPNCFLYLVERLLISVSCLRGYFLTTKSSFIEWLFYQRLNTNPSANSVTDMQFSLGGICDFVARILWRFLKNKEETADWIKNSNINFDYYYPLLVLRLVVSLCLLCANSGKYLELLSVLLGRNDITSMLPREFFTVLKRMRKRNYIEINKCLLAEAFKKMEDPLVIVNLGYDCPQLPSPDAIYVDMRGMQCKEDIMGVLFPCNTEAPQGKKVAVEENPTNSRGKKSSVNCDNQGKSFTVQSRDFTSAEDQSTNTENGNQGNLQTDWGLFWEISDVLKSVDDKRKGVLMKCMFPKMKVEVEKNIDIFTAAMSRSKREPCDENGVVFGEVNSMLDELRQLSSALDMSDQDLKNHNSKVLELLNKLQLRRPLLESFLNQLLAVEDTNAVSEAPETSIVSEASYDSKAVDEGTSNRNEDNMKASEATGSLKHKAMAILAMLTGTRGRETASPRKTGNE